MLATEEDIVPTPCILKSDVLKLPVILPVCSFMFTSSPTIYPNHLSSFSINSTKLPVSKSV